MNLSLLFSDHGILSQIKMLDITGPLNYDTPYVVIHELIATSGIYSQKDLLQFKPFSHLDLGLENADIVQNYVAVIDIINQNNYTVDFYISDLPVSVQFEMYVNPFENWSPKNLYFAVGHLFQYHHCYHSPSKKISSNSKFGLQTNTHPYQLNARVLYGLCKSAGVTRFHRGMSNEEMYRLYKYTQMSLNDLMVNFYSLPEEVLKKELPLLLIQTKSIPERFVFDPEKLKSIDQTRWNEPRSHHEAILCAAKNFKVDLTEAKQPLKEYYPLHKCKRKNLFWQPKDKQMKECQHKNPMMFYLYSNFNPYLPLSIYDIHDMMSLYLGFYPELPEEDPDILYQDLQEAYFTEHFYIGWYPTIVNQETPIYLEEVKQMSPMDMICLGVRNEKLYAMTWTELKDLFQNTKSFSHPIYPHQHLDENQLYRLMYLCERSNQKEMLEIIQYIQIFEKQNEKLFLDLQQTFHTNPSSFQQELTQFYHLALYMRGWDGKEEHPIQQVPIDQNMDDVEQRVSDYIVAHPFCSFIQKLPLILWKNKYIISQDEEQGLTIGDRLNIIYQGNQTPNLSSCIRMSSNCFLSSYLFYCQLFEIKTNFLQNQIKEIF
jgi:hypothetical protein